MAADQIVYFRGNETLNDHENIWDDRALIRAYDKAVALAKEGINNKQREFESENEDQGKKHKPRSKSKTKNMKQKPRKWKIGDTCKAIYSGDGLSYTAVIESINEEDGSCVVEFVDYGNKENISLSTLTTTKKRHLKSTKSSPGHKSDLDQMSSTYSDNGSTIGRRSNPWRFKQNSQCNTEPSPWVFPPPRSPAPSGHFPPFCYSGPWSGMNYHPPPMWDRFNMPSISPIPPPPVPCLNAETPDDVLASTLISWYMSGYHTGYYQAMRHFQKSDSRGHTPPFKKNRSSHKK